MFICNFKLNKKTFSKIFTILLIFLMVLIFALTIFKVCNNVRKAKDINTNENVIEIDSASYTNFLKSCHENIEEYIGDTIRITGYIYRMPDFTDSQFVLARTMILDSNKQAVVVGILCEYNGIKDFKDNTWITCKGTVKKGDYKGEMPVLVVSELENAELPEDEYVYPPSD